MVNYQRITLVNKTSKERLTMHLNLCFLQKNTEITYNQIVVAEVKQEKVTNSPIIDIFKKHGLRSGSISKYCLGVMSINPKIKYNRFKPKFLHLQKIIAF